MKIIIICCALVSSATAKESSTDIPWASTLSLRVGSGVHLLIFPFDDIFHKESHLIGLSLWHQTLLCPILDDAVPCHFDTLRFEARPANKILVDTTLANLAHLIVVDLFLKHMQRRLWLIPFGLYLHIISHWFYRHFLDSHGNFLPELFLSTIFINVSGMDRIDDLKLWEHVDGAYSGVR